MKTHTPLTPDEFSKFKVAVDSIIQDAGVQSSSNSMAVVEPELVYDTIRNDDSDRDAKDDLNFRLVLNSAQDDADDDEGQGERGAGYAGQGSAFLSASTNNDANAGNDGNGSPDPFAAVRGLKSQWNIPGA